MRTPLRNTKVLCMLFRCNLFIKSFAQVDMPQAIVVPTGSLGEVSEIRKKILEKTLKSSLDDYFAIVSKDLFEEAQEKALKMVSTFLQ